MNPFSKKQKPVVPGPDDPLNAGALRKAIAKLDVYQAEVEDYRKAIASWQSQYDDYLKTGDPRDEATAKQFGSLKTRLEMAPYHLPKAEAQVGEYIDAAITELLAFELRLVESGKAEFASISEIIYDAVAPTLQPYCRDDGEVRAAAACCGIGHGIPVARAAFGAYPEHDIYTYFGHPDFTFEGTPEYRRPEMEPRLRERAAALLSAHAKWQRHGGRWIEPGPTPLPSVPSGEETPMQMPMLP